MMDMNLVNDFMARVSLDESGHAFWIDSGRKAGRIHHTGYIEVGFKGRVFLLHRLIWAFHNGEVPDSQIDHKDGNKLNNSIENLRLATSSQNQQNAKRTTKTGFKGVAFLKNGRFQAQIGRSYIGSFKSAADAAAAYDAEAIKRYGDYARPNFQKKVTA